MGICLYLHLFYSTLHTAQGIQWRDRWARKDGKRRVTLPTCWREKTVKVVWDEQKCLRCRLGCPLPTPPYIHRHTHTEANILGWQVFRGPCYSKGVHVLAWPTRCPLWSLPALSGTLILSWQGQRGTSLDGKGSNSQQHGSGPVQPPRWRAQVLRAAVLCVWVCEHVEGKEVLWEMSFLYQSLLSGLPSYFYFLPARLAPSSPSFLSCLLRPLIMSSLMSSLARSISFILSCASLLTSGRAGKKTRRKREADAGRELFKVLLRPSLTE